MLQGAMGVKRSHRMAIANERWFWINVACVSFSETWNKK